MNSYKELLVYQKSMDLVVEIYKATRYFPSSENYALTDQLRRAVVSIPSNIAEGFDRKTSREYCQFLQVAYGSSAEVATQLTIALRLNYLSDEIYAQLDENLVVIRKMLHGLIVSIKSKYPHQAQGTSH